MTSDDEWHVLNEGDESLDEEQTYALQQAYMEFVKNFMDYVQSVDPQLFNRAKDYAIDYSGNDRVKFFDRDKEGEQ